MAVPEVTPVRLEATDADSIKAHLREHGYACVRCVRSALTSRTSQEQIIKHSSARLPAQP
jgi:hypothetical protein